MGTNYYLAAPHLADQYADPGAPGLHIGKSSAGWKFGWRGHPTLGLTSRAAWEDLFRSCGDAYIVNEYGDVSTFAEFREIADDEARRGFRCRVDQMRNSALCVACDDYHDDQGCDFLDREFC